MNDVAARLRLEAFDSMDPNGKTMKLWDDIRHQCEAQKGSVLPKLMFGSLIEYLAELMVDGADEIERLSLKKSVVKKPVTKLGKKRQWQEQCAKRRNEIYRSWLGGETVSALAKTHGVCRQRIHQIIRQEERAEKKLATA